jgi:3',5'-cyclic AMP phosphodiesterase CpdA
MLTIAQITDLHVTTDKDPVNKERNEKRLRAVLRAIHDRRPRPVAIIATGDLVDRGEPEEYAELKKILDEVELPVYLGLGNHDSRAPFRSAFPSAAVDANGFVQFAVDLGGVRVVMLDTLDEGKSDGAFCEKRAQWLSTTLGQAAHTPTIVALHHPPIASGIRWMDPDPNSEWIARLKKTLLGRKQVLTAISGHVHRTFVGMFAGHSLSAGPATSIQLTLDLSEVNMRVPDGREILVEEPPGYTLLMWYRGELATHFCPVGSFPPAVKYTVPFVAS